DQKAQVLDAMQPIRQLVRGQYAGYREETGVARDSRVETFAALRVEIDSWRWAGVPFLIRAGKCLATTATEVMVRLHSPPKILFDNAQRNANYVRFRLGPDRTA